MRTPVLLALGLSALTACALVTSWDGLGPPGASLPVDAGDGIDARAPVDAGGPADASDAATCVVGTFSCGGRIAGGDPSALYECQADRTPRLAIPCKRGCTERAMGNDACICVENTNYCGYDQVIGDPNVLYRCNGAEEPTVVMPCENACVVRENAQDICE